MTTEEQLIEIANRIAITRTVSPFLPLEVAREVREWLMMVECDVEEDISLLGRHITMLEGYSSERVNVGRLSYTPWDGSVERDDAVSFE